MAEAMLRSRLATRAPDVTVGSVGLRFSDKPAEPGAIKAMDKRGIDLSGFRSRTMTAELLAGASLILGMERLHVREVAVLGDELFARTFTLPEFVADADVFGPRTESIDQWVARIGVHRTPSDYLLDDPTAEVPDPMGQSNRAFRRCADLIDGLLEQLVDLTWPSTAEVGPGRLDPLNHGGR